MRRGTMRRYITGGLIALAVPAGLAAAAPCEPTASDREGTHWKAGAEQRGDLGSDLRVSGRVLEAGNCEPIPGARIESWQAGRDGRYSDRLRGWRLSGSDGSYGFITEWPGTPTPHVHFKVSAPGYRPVTTLWLGNPEIQPKEIHLEFVLLPQ